MARLAQARYPAQILIFFKLKMASPAILFLGIPRQGQVVILRPAGLQIFPRRDALGLTRKWALRNNKWDVIKKLGSNYKKMHQTRDYFIKYYFWILKILISLIVASAMFRWIFT